MTPPLTDQRQCKQKSLQRTAKGNMHTLSWIDSFIADLEFALILAEIAK